MFNLKAFITTNIVNGVKNGTFTKEYANIMAVNYLIKGVITEENVIEINSEIEEWEQSLVPEAPVEDTVEVPTEEVPEESTDELETPAEDVEESEEVAEPEAPEETEESETVEEVAE